MGDGTGVVGISAPDFNKKPLDGFVIQPPKGVEITHIYGVPVDVLIGDSSVKSAMISIHEPGKSIIQDPILDLRSPVVVVSGAGEGQSTKREQLLDSVQNDKLRNAVNEIYRPGASIGDGGLADAVRHELITGEMVGGKSHITKAQERIANLENIITKQNLSQADSDIAQSLLRDLKGSLGGKE